MEASPIWWGVTADGFYLCLLLLSLQHTVRTICPIFCCLSSALVNALCLCLEKMLVSIGLQ